MELTNVPAVKPRHPVWHWLVGGYLVVNAGLALIAFAMDFIGPLIYRDNMSYTLYGDPWSPVHMPWYAIWPMRLLSIVTGMFLVPLSVAVASVPFAVWLSPRKSALAGGTLAASQPWRPLLAVTLGATVVFLIAARLYGWF